jgi:hypothetical protein
MRSSTLQPSSTTASAPRRRVDTDVALLTASGPADRRQPADLHTAVDEQELAALREVIDLVGQLDLADPRLGLLVPRIDRALTVASQRSNDPRSRTWRAIAEDPREPLVVRLRALATAAAWLALTAS